MLCLLNITSTLRLCILIKPPICTFTFARITRINMHISVSRNFSQNPRKNPRWKKEEENVQVPRRATKQRASLISSKFRFFRSTFHQGLLRWNPYTFIITIADQFHALFSGLMIRADDLRTWKKKQLVNHKNVVILMERGTM